jgi:transposase
LDTFLEFLPKTNVADSKAALLLMRMMKDFLCSIKVILADRGYRGELAENVKKFYGYIINVVMRTYKDTNMEIKPINKRWIIKRTFAWFESDRRLCRNYELIAESSETMVKISAIKLLWNKI